MKTGLSLFFYVVSAFFLFVNLVNSSGDFHFLIYAIVHAAIFLSFGVILFRKKGLALNFGCAVLFGFSIGMMPYDIFIDIIRSIADGTYGQHSITFPKPDEDGYILRVLYGVFGLSIIHTLILAVMAATYSLIDDLKSVDA